MSEENTTKKEKKEKLINKHRIVLSQAQSSDLPQYLLGQYTQTFKA